MSVFAYEHVCKYVLFIINDVPTKDRTSDITKDVTVQAVTIQKLFVGRAGEGFLGTRPIYSVKVEQH